MTLVIVDTEITQIYTHHGVIELLLIMQTQSNTTFHCRSNMRVIILSSLVTLSLALPQSAPPVTCGTNERGLPRVEGESWMEDCNRCRCLPNNRPGCTRKFCGVPEFIQEPQEDVVTDTRTGDNNNDGGVHFPGATEDRSSAVKTCKDKEGNDRQQGESWKQECNTCG